MQNLKSSNGEQLNSDRIDTFKSIFLARNLYLLFTNKPAFDGELALEAPSSTVPVNASQRNLCTSTSTYIFFTLFFVKGWYPWCDPCAVERGTAVWIHKDRMIQNGGWVCNGIGYVELLRVSVVIRLSWGHHYGNSTSSSTMKCGNWEQIAITDFTRSNTYLNAKTFPIIIFQEDLNFTTQQHCMYHWIQYSTPRSYW